jgi:NitT/TauT family transport system substrate-binding protein
MRLRLYENFRFVLYAPFYAAHAIGAYAAEGLDVELLPSPGIGRAEEELLAGSVDVLWMGPMRVMKHHATNPGSSLVCFAEIVCRDPFSLVGRRPKPDFKLSDLSGMRFATVSEVPTPWLCLQEDLRHAGLDPERLDRIPDRSMAENLADLLEDRIDAAQLFEPVVEQALVSGGAHIWHEASSRGRTSYTAFVTTRDRLASEPEPLLRMTRAMYRTQQWISSHSPSDLASAIGSFFPKLEPRVLVGALTRYVAQGVWGRDPVLPEGGFERLGRALVSAGFIPRQIAFAECVDNSLAMKVLLNQG